MSKIKPIFLVLFISLLNLNLHSQTADEVVGQLMNEQKMFELREKHQEYEAQLSPLLNYFAEAMLAEAFNQPEKGIAAADALLSNEAFQQQLGLNNISYLIYLKAKFLEYQWQYKEISEILSSFLSQTKDYPISEDLRTSLKQSLRFAEHLKDAPQTAIKKPKKDVVITYKQENFKKGISLSLICQINGKSMPILLDTGNPKHSVITKALAQELNIETLVDSIPMQGVGSGYAQIGMGKRMQIGDLQIKNPLFYIVDQISPIDSIKIDAVLGSEILNHMGEIQIKTKKQQIVFPNELSELPVSGGNLIMNNLHLYLQVEQGSEKVLMHFDTGASASNMSNHYFAKNKDQIQQLAQTDSIRLAGFGGTTFHLGYQMPSLKFTLNETSFEMDYIAIHTEEAMNMWQEDGCFGADFIQAFDSVTLSYRRMFIAVD